MLGPAPAFRAARPGVVSASPRMPASLLATADFNGDGTFPTSAPPSYPVASNAPRGSGLAPVSLVVGDFNNDNHPDLAVSYPYKYNQASAVTVLLNKGDGTL